MPLLSGSSQKVISKNIETLMGDLGKSPHVQSRKQAIAIAYSKARRPKGKSYSHGAIAAARAMKA